MSKHYICIDVRDKKPFSIKAKNERELCNIIIAKNIDLNPEWSELWSELVLCQFGGSFSSAKAADEYMSSAKFASDLAFQTEIRDSLNP